MHLQLIRGSLAARESVLQTASRSVQWIRESMFVNMPNFVKKNEIWHERAHRIGSFSHAKFPLIGGSGDYGDGSPPPKKKSKFGRVSLDVPVLQRLSVVMIRVFVCHAFEW